MHVLLRGAVVKHFVFSHMWVSVEQIRKHKWSHLCIWPHYDGLINQKIGDSVIIISYFHIYIQGVWIVNGSYRQASGQCAIRALTQAVFDIILRIGGVKIVLLYGAVCILPASACNIKVDIHCGICLINSAYAIRWHLINIYHEWGWSHWNAVLKRNCAYNQFKFPDVCVLVIFEQTFPHG